MLLGTFSLALLLALAPPVHSGPGEAPAARTDTPSGQSFRFAGTRWGASADETRRALSDHGYAFEETGPGGELMFSGRMNAHPALVVAIFRLDGLAKILVSVPTEDDTALATYRELRRELGGAYGAPEIDVERYEYPFADGKHVGFEAAALRVGKATIGAQWRTNGEALGLKITDRLIVSAHYESPAWQLEVARRRN